MLGIDYNYNGGYVYHCSTGNIAANFAVNAAAYINTADNTISRRRVYSLLCIYNYLKYKNQSKSHMSPMIALHIIVQC